MNVSGIFRVREGGIALPSSPRRFLSHQNHRIMWPHGATLSVIKLEFNDSFAHDFNASFLIENVLS